MTSEALNVHRAFSISLWVGGIAFAIAVLSILTYLFVEERKYRSQSEGKHTKTQDKLKIVTLEDGEDVSEFTPEHISHGIKVTGRHAAPVEPKSFDPAVTTPDLARVVQNVAAHGKHHAMMDELILERPVYSVTETVVDMGIPREVLDYDGPVTRNDFLKTSWPQRAGETDYFDKIKDMVDGIQ